MAIIYLVIVLHIWIILVVIWLQLVQVLQISIVIPVLGFLGDGSIMILQLLLHILRRLRECQNGEVKSQLCLKFSRIWCLLCNIWRICTVTVLFQCNIHMIYEYHMLIYYQVCHILLFLFLVVQMVFNWIWICQRVVNDRIDLYWFWIFASDS